MSTSCLEGSLDLVEDLVGRLSSKSKHWVHIGVVSTAFPCEERSKLLIVKFVISIAVVLLENCLDLVFFESASQGFKSLLELVRFDGSESIQVKVLEDLPNCLSFIISSMSSLSHFFKYDILKLSDSLRRNEGALCGNTPSFQDDLYEVIIFLLRKAGVAICVVFDEIIFSYDSAPSSLAHARDKVIVHSLWLLLSCSHSGMGSSVVLLSQSFEGHLT